MNNRLPIGIFDSGIGGLTVYKQVKKLLPGEDIIYFGDTARAPYGQRPRQQIRNFVDEILDFMDVCNIKVGISACNTITVLGLDCLQGNHLFPIMGMSRGAQLAIDSSKNKRIGIIGTEFTISSGRHQAEITNLDSQAKVYGKACPKLASLIEKGNLAGIEMREAIFEYLEPLKEEKIDTLLLACTHYPYIKSCIQEFMGHTVAIIDPAEETAQQVCDLLARKGGLNPKDTGVSRLYFSNNAEHALGIANHIIDTSACLLFEGEAKTLKNHPCQSY